MTDKTDSFSDSFNEEFCTQLEYRLSKAFSNSGKSELNNFWCDGISWTPYYNEEVNRDYLSLEKVEERKEIRTTSWIGPDGQDQYEMTIKLGLVSIEKYKKGENLEDCIPDSQSMDWIDIDIKNKRILIYLM